MNKEEMIKRSEELEQEIEDAKDEEERKAKTRELNLLLIALTDYKENKEVDLRQIYDLIIQVLREYCDLREDYYNIIALWTIGTWIHNQFPTYPYLFLNAMKSSGKTRLMKILSHLCKHGELLANMSEAVLFRIAENSTLLIDEFEGISKREKSALRELLNCAYKSGTKVKRLYKSKGVSREEQRIEEFNVYCPIAMANISGMESILSDRCITLILEKSDQKKITRKMEIFDFDKNIKKIKELFGFVATCTTFPTFPSIERLYNVWNSYLDTCDISGDSGYSGYSGDSGYSVTLFKRIKDLEIDGRHLELFFPLFILSEKLGVLEETIKFALLTVKDRQEQDVLENRDISLIDFISQKDETIDFIPIKELVNEFRVYADLQEEDNINWLNPSWMGRSLRRIGLIIDQRKQRAGREVMINFTKAKQKIKILKPLKEIKKKEEGTIPQESELLNQIEKIQDA